MSMDTKTVQEIRDTTKKVLELLNVKAEPVVEVDESEVVKINISPAEPEQSLGILIGHRGEVLDALQLILALIVNQKREEWLRLLVDVDDYRKRHEESLRALAQRSAEKARFLKEPVALSPMSAYNRRVIHLAISEIPNMESESVGEEPERRVVIKPQT